MSITENTKSRRSSTSNVTLITLFLVVIGFPFFDTIFGITSDRENTENHKMAEFPEFSMRRLSVYPSLLNNWFSENFRPRTQLFYAYALYKFRVLGVSPVPGTMLVGKNNWFYYSEAALDNYCRVNPATDVELEKAYNGLMSTYNYCQSKGIKYYLYICPDGQSVYPENLPDNVRQPKGIPGNVQAFLAYLKAKNCPVTPIFEVEYLKSKKPLGRLYYKTDSHWNMLGGFYGYEKLMEHVNADFPSIKARTLAEYTIDSTEKRSGDLLFASALHHEEDLKENNIVLKPRFIEMYKSLSDIVIIHETWKEKFFVKRFVTPGLSLPKVLIFHDSFVGGMAEALKNTFSPLSLVKGHPVSKKIIDEEKPDILIDMLVERSIMNVLY